MATPAIVRHEPILVKIRRPAPTRHSSAEVSPSDPGTRPMKAFHQSQFSHAPKLAAESARMVAPAKLSTPMKSAAIHGASPEMSAG